jgi:hypothetical protein
MFVKDQIQTVTSTVYSLMLDARWNDKKKHTHKKVMVLGQCNLLWFWSSFTDKKK